MEWNPWEELKKQEETGKINAFRIVCDRSGCSHQKEWVCKHPHRGEWTKWDASLSKEVCPAS